MIIVGLNAYHGDVAAVVLRDGALVAALEEERFCRIKHVAGFPARAIETTLAMAAGAAVRSDAPLVGSPLMTSGTPCSTSLLPMCATMRTTSAMRCGSQAMSVRIE